MRRALMVAAVAVGVAAAALGLLWRASHRRATEIVFTWGNGRNAQTPNCSAQVRTSCIAGFTLLDATASRVVSRTIDPAARSYRYAPPGGMAVGYQHRFLLTTNARDAAGMPVDSAPAIVTVRYTAWSALRVAGWLRGKGRTGAVGASVR